MPPAKSFNVRISIAMPTKPSVHRPQTRRTPVHVPHTANKTDHNWMYGRKWKQARAGYLAMNPLCKMCRDEGHTTPANVVDHITPHKGDPVLFWAEDNWQPICTAHHNRKTASEDGGFGNRTRT